MNIRAEYAALLPEIDRRHVSAPGNSTLHFAPTVESKRRAFVLWKVAARLERLMRTREEKAK